MARAHPDHSARSLALEALRRWRESEHFSDRIIQDLLNESSLPSNDRAFALELFYGVLRNLTLLDFFLKSLRAGPLDAGSRDLLRIGLYQTFWLDVAEHAAVFETVALAPKRARPLINGVLRSALRRRVELMAQRDLQPLAVQFSHPDFLIEKWRNNFGDEATSALCAWNNSPPLVFARINRLQISAQDFLQRYTSAQPLHGRDNFVTHAPGSAIDSGDCYIQDPSTAIACELLAPEPAETVLDACAAPGGKTAYLAELMQNAGMLVACDRDVRRLERLEQNLRRLRVTNARALPCDWLDPASTTQLGQSFDRILIDAPCTNTGVMRRRVDVRWRLRPNSFALAQDQQLGILRAVLPLLKPEGVLVYSTCSIEPEENEAVAAMVAREFPKLHLSAQRFVRPFADHFDGAFAARFERAA